MEIVVRPHVDNFVAWSKDKPEVVVMTADLTNSCEVGPWAATYPDRFFSMKMAEQNMMGFAAGLAREGLQPWIHTFAVFIYRRPYDQLAMSIAYPNLPVRFAAQTSIGLARNPELLKLAEAAGAALFFIGFESVDRQALKEANKKNRPGEFAALVQRLHDAHIAVEGGFIFGFDSDGPGVFADTVRAADEIGVDTAHFTILTPLPGTNTFSRLHEDGRIFDYDWSHYNAYRTLFQPARMSVATLDAGARWAYGAFYSKTARRRRTLAQIRRSSPVMAAAYRFVGGSYARHYGVGLQGSDERPFRPHPDDIANLAAVSDADANQVLIQALARVADGASGSAGSSQPVAVELGRPAASATRG